MSVNAALGVVSYTSSTIASLQLFPSRKHGVFYRRLQKAETANYIFTIKGMQKWNERYGTFTFLNEPGPALLHC